MDGSDGGDGDVNENTRPRALRPLDPDADPPPAPAASSRTLQLTWALVFSVLLGGGLGWMWTHDGRWAVTGVVGALIVAMVGAVLGSTER